ncbi:hypothetical protein LXA43DRAFT_1095560 [Ganoderma leucocontextum]|nr:hypothetical protein LXA43DRAFT_1095560 [Ganoderma leucocontextum]
MPFKATRRIRLRGFLQALTQLPLELRFMIFEQLHPWDLLHLSQTCHAFRSLFLSRENEAIWRRSRENCDDVPDWPSSLSEPAFIHLLHSPYCHHCASIVRKINWAWYTRVCQRCVQQVSYGADDVRSRLQTWSKFLPQGDPGHLGRLFDIYSLRPDSNSRDNDNNARFYKRQVDGFLQKPPSPNTAFSSNALAKARETVEKHAGELWERSMYRGDLQQWSIDRERNRDIVLNERREQRFADIVERLRQSGWNEEI